MSFLNILGKIGKAALDITVSAGERANSITQEAKALAPEMESKSVDDLQHIVTKRGGAKKMAAAKELRNRGL